MAPPSSSGSVVVDASVVVALAANEPGRYPVALAAIQQYIADDRLLYAPQLLAMEAVYALCRKMQDGLLTAAEHTLSIANLQSFLALLSPAPVSDAQLIARAE